MAREATSSQRIGYMSAMALLECRDGAVGDYIEIAEAIERTDGEGGQEGPR